MMVLGPVRIGPPAYNEFNAVGAGVKLLTMKLVGVPPVEVKFTGFTAPIASREQTV